MNFFYYCCPLLSVNTVCKYIHVMNPVIYLILCFNFLIFNDLDNAYRYHSKTLCLQSLDLKFVSHLICIITNLQSTLCHCTFMLAFHCHVMICTKATCMPHQFVSQLCNCNVTLLQYLIWVMTQYFSLE